MDERRGVVAGKRPTKTGDRPGARTRLTNELRDQVVEYLRAGNTIRTSTSAAGISHDTHYEWMKRGEAGEKPFADYSDAVTRAIETAEIRNVTLIQRHAQTDWRAAAWYLERSRREEWGKTTRTEISGPDGGPIEIDGDPRQRVLALFPTDDGSESV
jgi:transposase